MSVILASINYVCFFTHRKFAISTSEPFSADAAAASAIAKAAIPSHNETGMGVFVFNAVTNAAHSF